MKEIFERFPEGSSVFLTLMFGYKCGLRIGEAFAVTWNDINFENKTLCVRRQVQIVIFIIPIKWKKKALKFCPRCLNNYYFQMLKIC